MKKITLIFSISFVVIALVYDAVAIYYGGTEASISLMVIEYSKEFPLIPLLTGILCGHFFWGIKLTKSQLTKLPYEKFLEVEKWVKEIRETRDDLKENFK